MKRLFLIASFAMLMPVLCQAQKNTIVQYMNTQARILDVSSNAYVKPLTVELKIKSQQRIREIVKIPKANAIGAMNADPNNWRSYAVYEVSKRLNCDVIVAATFNIKFDEVAGDKDVQIEVVGFPADFTNWQTATNQDLEWIKTDILSTTANRTNVNAAIKDTK